jgi:PTS system cellobiose-specific IIC component
LFVPFLLSPITIGILTYFAMQFDLVNKPFILVPWTLPAPIGAYLATGGDWRAIVLVLVNITIATALYYPFLKAYERKLIREGAAGELQEEIK